MTSRSPAASRIVAASPVYYGWVVWLVAMIGVMGSAPGQSFSISLFVDYFIVDFALDRTTVSGLYGAGTLIAALALTWVGKQIDRWGNRRVGAIIGGLLAFALVCCASIGGPFALLLAFIALRGLGQGSLSLASSTAVANWFLRRRGRMMALLALAFALFQGLYVSLLRVLLELVDWRAAFLILGLGVAVLVVPAFALFMRDTPEQHGLTPDDRRAIPANSTVATGGSEIDWTLREAMRAPLFWVFTLARILPSAWGTGLILHQISIFAALDHSAQVVTETFALMSLFTAASSLFAGYLVDRVKPSYVVVIQMLALVAALLLAMTMRDSARLALYALTLGLGMGIGYVFDGAVWPNLFGRGFQGEIRGFVYTAMVAGSALGPALFGLSYDTAGGYLPVLWAGVALGLVVLLLALVTPQSARRAASA